MCMRQGYMIKDMERNCVITGVFWKVYGKVDQMKYNLQDQANDPALWDVLKCKFKKSSTSNTYYRNDDFHSQHHDDHQDDDAPHDMLSNQFRNAEEYAYHLEQATNFIENQIV
ncbi:hypothetical protein Tco_1459618 [Tanacetum coccineum]